MDNSCVLDLLIRCFAMTEPEDLNFTAFTDLCRLCSLKSGPRLHIFDKDAEQRQILYKLRACLPTMVSKDDLLPKKICERCVTRLEQLYEWRQSCLTTDTVLRNYAESMRVVTSTINFQDGTVNMDKMTEAQKTAYLEAHVAVQQHMAAAAAAARREQQQQQTQQSQQQTQQTQQQTQPTRQHHENSNMQQTQQTAGGSSGSGAGGAGPSPPAAVSSTQHHYNNINSPIKVPQVSSSTGNNGTADSTFTVPDDVGMGYEGGVRVLQSLGNWSPEVSNNIPRPNLIPFTEPYAEGGSMHPGTRMKALQTTPATTNSQRKHTNTHKNTNAGTKAFECTVCGKGLARKDKLTIHMRIHTGEKPYVCEVCNKAFARRDKLVLHMNKLKHVTPSNIAPLGKRTITINTLKMEDVKPLTLGTQHPKQEDTKPSQAEIAAAAVAANAQHQQLQSSGMHVGSTSTMVVSWSCELCGRLFATRDEWSAHAKSHLATAHDNKHIQHHHQEKMQHQQHQQQQQQNHQQQQQQQQQKQQQQQQNVVSDNKLVVQQQHGVVAHTLPPTQDYFPTHYHHAHHLCLMCRQEFTGKAEFMFHVRGHFEGKVTDLAAADVLARSLMDNSLCT